MALKLTLAQWLVTAGVMWPLRLRLPWWLLTDHPARNDVMTVLDGTSVIVFIAATAQICTFMIALPLLAAARVMGPMHGGPMHGLSRVWHLAMCRLPLAACGVILGLLAQTVTLLRQDGLALSWAQDARAMLLGGAVLFSLLLLWRVTDQYASGWRRVTGALTGGLAVAASLVPWGLLFWGW